MKNGLAARQAQSVRFTVVAWTLTSSPFSLAAGFSTSEIRTTSGGPYLVWTAPSWPECSEPPCDPEGTRRLTESPLQAGSLTVITTPT
jgi:hypothetical protein